MKFSELVHLLEKNGFRIVKEKGSVRYYARPDWPHLIRVDFHGSKEVPTGACHSYSLVIEATDEPDYFGFYSPELEGFTGIGHSIEDCIYKAKWGMKEHLDLLAERSLPIPEPNSDPKITIQNARKAA